MSRQQRTIDDDVRTQLGSIFSRAREALGEVKDAVVRNSQIGKIKLDASFLRRERDGFVQALGAALYERSERGDIELPADLGELVGRIRALDARLEDQEAELAAVEAEAEMQREAARAAARAAREAAVDLAPDKYELHAAAAEETAPAEAVPAAEPGPEERAGAKKS
ncbi:hypothetical protein [Vulgatibacter sp.]|uniref:hypothetical protein n=1 Tax=Vulgatibacter sp. TaxID=1971226 RepID=UPI003567220F